MRACYRLRQVRGKKTTGVILEPWIISNESAVRLAVFTGVALLVVAWEIATPFCKPPSSAFKRPMNNLLLSVLNSVVARVLIPLTAVSLAIRCEVAGVGLLNVVTFSGWLEVVIAVVLLDFVMYWQHRLFHTVPLLWRLHRVHHADLHVDWTTGVRFHPLEYSVSMGIKFTAMLLIGASPLAVIVFEVLLNATSMFNHANARMPVSMDRILLRLLVTPSLHRIHHSVMLTEQRHNYGFNLTLWDRLFGTLLTPESRGDTPLTTGVLELRRPDLTQPVAALLTLPFQPITPRLERS